jgi:hypothetical protein
MWISTRISASLVIDPPGGSRNVSEFHESYRREGYTSPSIGMS